MALPTAPPNLMDYDHAGLVAFFDELGEKKFRATQVFQWLYQKGVTDFTAMSNVSKSLRAKLQQTTRVQMPEIQIEQASDDGSRKWLLRLDEHNGIETVFIPEDNRGTLCISSQVGCALDCSFCSTGKQGFNRNLTTAEIIGQLWVANHALQGDTLHNRKITNVVMMGMGEPLANFDAVVRAIRIMMDDFGFGLSRRRVTVSTAGMVPAMDRLGELCGGVSLAVSLHAPNDALRDELVPLNRKYPIAQLLAACKRYVDNQTHRKITFEYTLLAGVNDQPQHAHELTKILRDIPCKINLIPFNPFPGTQYKTPGRRRIDAFRDILYAAGYTTVTRKTRGDDIDAACGQLVGQVTDRTRRTQNKVPFVAEVASSAQSAR